MTSTTSSSAGRRCSRTATSTRRRCRSRKAARPRARQGLDPRGARPRVLPLAPVRGAPAAEFEAVVERAPTNDYALFCLGRSLLQLGRPRGAQAARAGRRDCARTAATTASTATARARRRHRRYRCYKLNRRSFRVAAALGRRGAESGRSPAFFCRGEGGRTMSSRSRPRSRPRLADVEPEVEVLLAEVVGGDLRAPVHRPSRRRHARALRARHEPPRLDVREHYALEVSSPGPRAPADQARALPPLRRPARARAHARRARRPHGRSPASWSARPTTRSRSPPTPASSRSRTPTSIVRTSWETEAHVTRDRRGRTGARAREGHLRGEADGRARGRAAVGLQEAARRGQATRA